MRYEIRPLGLWTAPVTRNRPWCRFRASWSDTLDLLGRETENGPVALPPPAGLDRWAQGIEAWARGRASAELAATGLTAEQEVRAIALDVAVRARAMAPTVHDLVACAGELADWIRDGIIPGDQR